MPLTRSLSSVASLLTEAGAWADSDPRAPETRIKRVKHSRAMPFHGLACTQASDPACPLLPQGLRRVFNLVLNLKLTEEAKRDLVAYLYTLSRTSIPSSTITT